MRSLSIILLFLCVFSIEAKAQDESEDVKAFEYSLWYIGDAVSNFSGGIKTGSTYLGLVGATAALNTEGLGLWKGGQLFLDVQNTHLGTPSESLVGDMQVLSNIDNGDYSYMFQLWYSQQIAATKLTFGYHDLNSVFFAGDLTGEYVNSSFGIMPLASLNAPVSIFPKTSLAFVAEIGLTNNLVLNAAVYEGNPLDLDEDPYNLSFHFDADDGFFSVSEIHYSVEKEERWFGTYKLGGYYHSSDFIDVTSEEMHKGNYGVYFMGEQALLYENEEDSQGLAMFVQTGFSPDDRSINDVYLALGVNYTGLLPNRNDDILAIGLAHASISNQLIDEAQGAEMEDETAIEFFYKMPIGEHIILQPNFQYIINPGGTSAYENAFVGLLRFVVEF